MRTKKLSLLLLSILILQGCNFRKDSQTDEANIKEIYIDLSKKQQDFYDIANDIEPDFDIIALETSDSCLIGYIRKIIYANDLYYIQDNKGASIFIFSNDGKFVSKLDKKWAGPDEYINISSFAVKDRCIWIYDDVTKKLLCYNASFDKIKEIKIDIPCFDMIAFENNILLATNWFWYGNESYQLKNYNLTNEKTTEFFPFSQFEKSDIITTMKSNQFAKLGDSCLFMYSHDNKLYQISANNIIPQYKYTFSDRFEDKPLTNEMLNQKSNLIRGIDALFQTNKNIIIKYEDSGEPTLAIYDKENENCKIHPSVFVNSDFVNFKIYRYFISENQEIISVYEPETLINYISEIYDEKENQNLSKKRELDSVLSDLSIGDNQVIIKYKLSKDSKL